MYPATATKTRSATSTCTKSRVEAILDLFLGDVAAFISRGMVSVDRAQGWLRDLSDVLMLEAVERFQLKLTLADGGEKALDYEVSDDGRIGATDGSGGFASHWIPAGSKVTLVIRWRKGAARLEEARKLLRDRGWGPATMLDASSAAERTYSKDGYGVLRRTVGNWPV